MVASPAEEHVLSRHKTLGQLLERHWQNPSVSSLYVGQQIPNWKMVSLDSMITASQAGWIIQSLYGGRFNIWLSFLYSSSSHWSSGWTFYSSKTRILLLPNKLNKLFKPEILKHTFIILEINVFIIECVHTYGLCPCMCADEWAQVSLCMWGSQENVQGRFCLPLESNPGLQSCASKSQTPLPISPAPSPSSEWCKIASEQLECWLKAGSKCCIDWLGFLSSVEWS